MVKGMIGQKLMEKDNASVKMGEVSKSNAVKWYGQWAHFKTRK